MSMINDDVCKAYDTDATYLADTCQPAAARYQYTTVDEHDHKTSMSNRAYEKITKSEDHDQQLLAFNSNQTVTNDYMIVIVDKHNDV